MINLLPTEYSNRLRFARQNTLIRKWLAGALAAIFGLLAILALGSLYISQPSKNIQRGIDSTQKQLETEKLKTVEKQSKEISDNIKVINQVLNKEIRFSALVTDIAKIMPSGSVLASLSISQVDGAIDLSVNTTDYGSALQTSANLSDSKNNIFDKVDIISINCSPAGSSTYSCSSTFKALFSKTVPSRYLSVAKAAT